MGTQSFPGVKSGRGVTLTPHPVLVPRSRMGRAIPLLPLWTVRPVQSLSACTRVTFIFTFFSGNSVIMIRNIRLGSTVTIVTLLHVGQPRHKGFLSHSVYPASPIHWRLGVNWAGCEADRSPRINIEAKNEWGCISTPPIRLHLLRCHKFTIAF